MAKRTLIENGSGALGQMPDIRLTGGKMSEETALTVSSKIQGIIAALNGGLSLGTGETGSKAGNIRAQYVDVLTPGSANAEFIVPHGLGVKPIGYAVVRKDRAVDVYDSSAGSWTDELLYLKASVASATVRLLIW